MDCNACHGGAVVVRGNPCEYKMPHGYVQIEACEYCLRFRAHQLAAKQLVGDDYLVINCSCDAVHVIAPDPEAQDGQDEPEGSGFFPDIDARKMYKRLLNVGMPEKYMVNADMIWVCESCGWWNAEADYRCDECNSFRKSFVKESPPAKGKNPESSEDVKEMLRRIQSR